MKDYAVCAETQFDWLLAVQDLKRRRGGFPPSAPPGSPLSVPAWRRLERLGTLSPPGLQTDDCRKLTYATL